MPPTIHTIHTFTCTEFATSEKPRNRHTCTPFARIIYANCYCYSWVMHWNAFCYCCSPLVLRLLITSIVYFLVICPFPFRFICTLSYPFRYPLYLLIMCVVFVGWVVRQERELHFDGTQSLVFLYMASANVFPPPTNSFILFVSLCVVCYFWVLTCAACCVQKAFCVEIAIAALT